MSTDWIPTTGLSTRFPVYTRSNANDVLPNPISPLGATISWIPGVIEGWRDGNVRMGSFDMAELMAEGINPVCGFINGYFYVNASVVRVFGERSGAGAAGVDAAFFGSRPDTPPYIAHPDDHSDEAAARIGQNMGWVMTAQDWPDLDESKRLADGARAARPDLSALSDAGLVAHARSLVPLLRKMFDDHVLSSSNTAVGPAILGQVAGAIDPNLPLRLMSSSGDVDSALPSYAMWALSRKANAAPEVRVAFAQGVAGLLDRLRASGSSEATAWLADFEQFLVDFGSRGPNEWDPFSDTWETKPVLALSLVERMLGVPDAHDPTGRHDAVTADREAATAEALAALGDDDEAKGLLLAAQSSALHFLAWRERTKTNCIKVINEQRLALCELGRRATAAGHLADPKQVFLLTADELEAFVAHPAAFTTVVGEREAAWRHVWDVEPPYFVETNRGVPTLDQLVPRGGTVDTLAAPGDVLQGGPGCSGKVRGRACIVLDPADPSALEVGDILIAPQTDPSWTPLFVPAAGVVVDVGAMNSHAVIVSRELGIPCAVGVVDASKRIPDGALVEVDGGAGTVTLL